MSATLEFVQIQTTVASQADGLKLSEMLVERKLAACCQVVGPITSVYRWQGAIERSEEWLCLAKTRADLFAHAETVIRGTHSYETPQIVALPIVAGSQAYLAWVDQQLRSA